MVNNKIKNVLESFYLIPAIYVFAVLGRVFDVIQITLPIIALTVILILVFCDDVKNVLGIIFYAPFYIKDISMNLRFELYVAVIACVVLALIYFFVRSVLSLKKQKEKIKGKLYVPLIIITVAYLLGGIAYDFNLFNAVTILTLSIATFLFYYIALNCTKDIGKYMNKVFVVGAVLVSFMVLYENFVNYGGIKYIFNRSRYTWVCAENVNVAATFILLGLCGAFGLGYKTNKDGIWLIVASCFYFFIVITYCRMMTAIGALALLVFTIVNFIKSPRKRIYLIYIGAIIIVGIAIIISFWDVIYNILHALIGKKGMTGRDELWPWCIEMFKQNPIFGIGFKIEEKVPMMGAGAAHYVLAHNTLIQWLVSLGIVGALCMLVFTAFKYRIILKDFFGEGVVLRLLIIFVALSGITDQAPQMDPFIYNIIIVVIASIESISFYSNKKKEE